MPAAARAQNTPRRRPQKPGLGIPGCGHPIDDPALSDAAAEPGLHGGDARQAAGGALVGERKALAIAVKGAQARRRWSKLREWLIGGDTPGTKRAES
jgi:hypothetical protein